MSDEKKIDNRKDRLVTAALSSAELKERLKIFCVINKVMMKDVIESAIIEYLDKNESK